MSRLENNIGWCDVTMNPGIGCRGCELGDDCYAKFDTPARVLRAGKWAGYEGKPTETFGKDRVFVPTIKGLAGLRSLNKLCICDKCHETWGWAAMGTPCAVKTESGYCMGELRRIRCFADSNSDWMDWPVEILAQALDEIRQAPNVDVILLTKWPWLWRERMTSAREWFSNNPHEHDSEMVVWIDDWLNNRPPQNMVTLTSVLGNANDAKRIQGILDIPSARRGLSCEPLWDLPEVECFIKPGTIDWAIIGCDSSTKRRGWYEYASNFTLMMPLLRHLEIKVYHKQMPVSAGWKSSRCDDSVVAARQPPPSRGSLNMNEWPEGFRVREFYKPQ